jgi:phosphoglycolate phosphatase
LSVEEIASHVGSGARALLRGVLGEEAENAPFDELFRSFQAYYAEHPTDENTFMPGAEAALHLRSAERKVALCTNKPIHLTQVVLERLGWTERFDAVVAPAPGDRVKPDPQLLVRVADQLGVAPQDLVMIGDGPQDVGSGHAVGAHTIGVKGGLLPLERLLAAQPDCLLETLLELPGYLGI